MRKSSSWALLPAIVIIFAVSGWGQNTASTKPTPVEVWSGGDDSLTQGLRNALENAFKSSSEFVLSSGKKAGTLIVLIPTHVGWRSMKGRTQISYLVQFESIDSQELGITSGTCFDDAFPKCATHVVQEARKLRGRIK